MPRSLDIAITARGYTSTNKNLCVFRWPTFDFHARFFALRGVFRKRDHGFRANFAFSNVFARLANELRVLNDFRRRVVPHDIRDRFAGFGFHFDGRAYAVFSVPFDRGRFFLGWFAFQEVFDRIQRGTGTASARSRRSESSPSPVNVRAQSIPRRHDERGRVFESCSYEYAFLT